MPHIKFMKFCASGNDFIVIDNRQHTVPRPESGFAKAICRRKTSIGADGLLLLDKIRGKFRMRIFNADGSEAEMCGNGARAFAMFVHKTGLGGKYINFVTKAGPINAEIIGENVKIKMTVPTNIKLNITLKVKGRNYRGCFINTGVPHCVIMVSNLEKFPVNETGRIIRFHKKFAPAGTNADFVSIRNGKIFLRTYERGVEDETLACGTGAVASALISSLTGKIKKLPAYVIVKGGKLKIYFKRAECGPRFKDVYLEGDARIVYNGIIEEEAYV